jgi:hypothetical protein
MKTKPLAGPTLVPWTARQREKLKPVLQGAYGVVRIAGGHLKGHLGLYDDDDERNLAIVYPLGPPPADYLVCRRSSLAKAAAAEDEAWWTVNANQIATRIAVNEFKRRVRERHGESAD